MAHDPQVIRILFIIDYFHRTGGTETHLALLGRWLVAHGFHCEVVVFDLGQNELIEEMRRAGVVVHHISVAREYDLNAVRKAFELARLIRRQRFDIVQTFHQKSDTYGALIARLAGVRHIISSKRDTGHLRKPHHFFLNRRLRFLFEKTIVVAAAVAAAVEQSDRLDRARLVRIYNGVDCDRFAPATAEQAASARRDLGLRAEDFVVGIVAGLRPEKDHATLFDAAALALPHIPNLKVLVVGGGPLLSQLRERYCGAGSTVIFAGDRREIWRILPAMDVACLVPASNEGFSNAIVEKMAAGLPLVVTNVGGNTEAVVDGENGYVIAPRDSQALMRALVRLHANPDERVQMGRRSRQLAEQNFSLQQMCERHAELYRDVCGVDASGARNIRTSAQHGFQ